jgi:uncharacterized protein YukE
MGAGFSVTPSALQAGSQDVASLQGRCMAVGQDAVGALTAMAGTAGHPGLESALTGAAGRGNKAFTGMWAAYGHCSQGLATSAQTYSSNESALANRIGTVYRTAFLNGMG